MITSTSSASKRLHGVLLVTLVLVWGTQETLKAQVPSSDVTLQPVISDNLPVIGLITSFGDQELKGALPSWTQFPLMTPWDSYDRGADYWWNNLVSEQTQARAPLIMLNGEGTYVTDPTVPWGPGNMNSNLIHNFFDAVNRRGAANTFKVGYFAGEAAFQSIYDQYYNQPNAPFDCSNQDAWNQVAWLRVIKPWFDQVPSSYYANINGKIPIEFWGLEGTSMSNRTNNFSAMLNFLAGKIQQNYGVTPGFVFGSINAVDPSLSSNIYMLGDNEWFNPPSTPYTITSYTAAGSSGPFKTEGFVPGFINTNYWDPNSPSYHQASGVLPRNGVNGTGGNGDTFISCLDAAYSGGVNLGLIEGYEDASESCAQFRTVPGTSGWDYPNQYINILRKYCDPRTVTLRLDAAACDNYYKQSGPSTTVYRRTGNLGVRCLTGSATVTASSVYQGTPPFGQSAFESNAFDITSNSYWWTANSVTSAWLRYDCGSGNPRVVTQYDIMANDFNTSLNPQAWTFQGSNDGNNWTTLDTHWSEVFTKGQVKDYGFPNSTAYRYYQLNISGVAGGSNIALSELAFKTNPSTANEDWVVTSTAANEWIEFKGVALSDGNYKFPISYSATSPHTLQLLIDGVAQPQVTLPSTGGMNNFSTAYLAAVPVIHGSHTLRVKFIDGGVDVDYLFVKKYDPMMSFQSALTGNYCTAQSGGNNAGLHANTSNVGGWQQFSVNDFLSSAGAIPASSYNTGSSSSGMSLESCSEGGQDLAGINNGAYAVFNNVNLNAVTGFNFRTASAGAGGTIGIHLDSTTGTLIGTCTVPVTGAWQTYSSQWCPVSGAAGTHSIYLTFSGGSGGLFNLEWFAPQSLNGIFARSYNRSESSSSPWLESCGEGGQDLGGINNGTYAAFDNVNLNGITAFTVRTASAGAGGNIQIHLDSPTGTLVGTCTVPVTGNWQTYSTQTCGISGASGTHTVYLTFNGGSGGLFNLEWFALQGVPNAIPAVAFNPSESSSGPSLEPCGEGGKDMGNCNNGTYVAFDNVQLDGVNYLVARTASAGAGGTIQVHLDSPTGTLIGTCTVPITGNWQTYMSEGCTLASTSGVHTLYLTFSGGGGGLFNLQYFTLQGANTNLVCNGDTLTVQVRDGLYLTADGGGGSNMEDNRLVPGAWEFFKIVKLNLGSAAIQSGDKIALISSNGTNYLTATSSNLSATGTSVGTGQTFTTGIYSQ